MFHNCFFFRKSSVYDATWKNVIDPDRPQMTIWRTRFKFWIPEATKTHSEYVTIIVYPQQRWLHKRASVSRYTCIDCPVFCVFIWKSRHRTTPKYTKI